MLVTFSALFFICSNLISNNPNPIANPLIVGLKIILLFFSRIDWFRSNTLFF